MESASRLLTTSSMASTLARSRMDRPGPARRIRFSARYAAVYAVSRRANLSGGVGATMQPDEADAAGILPRALEYAFELASQVLTGTGLIAMPPGLTAAPVERGRPHRAHGGGLDRAR